MAFRPSRCVELWLGRHCVLVAWLGLVLAVLSPPHGSSLLACWFRGATGVPCPGCGLTRSLSCAIRGLFVESWHYHPLGLLILALFAFTIAQSLLPEAVRQRLYAQIESRGAFFRNLYTAFVVAFVGFGAFRALVRCWQLLSGC